MSGRPGEEERDVNMVQAIDELRALPPVSPAAVSRIVAAAVAARAAAVGTVDDTPAYLPAPRSRFFVAGIAASIAAAALIGFVARGALMDGGSPTVAENAPGGAAAPTGISPVAATNTDLLPIPTQFQLARPDAKDVLLIGDFNGWGSDTLRLARDASGVWLATVPIVPGRHIYAFVVDGKVVLDPRQPTFKDPEFGVLRSVVIVGKP